VVIAVRFIWIVPAALIPRWLSKRIVKLNPSTHGIWWCLDGRDAWCGINGGRAGAATYFAGWHRFSPQKFNIYLTFCVILSTLVITWFFIEVDRAKAKLEPYSIVAEEYEVRTQVVSSVISHIEETFPWCRMNYSQYQEQI